MSNSRPHKDEFAGDATPDDYSADTIYRSIGDLDHAKSVRGIWGNVTVSSVLRQRINRVVTELGKDIYRSVSDLERDALDHRCAYWEGQLKLEEPTCRELRLSRLEGSLRSIIESEEHHQSFYCYLEDKFRDARSAEIKLMLKLETEQYASSLSDPYWKDRYSRLIDRLTP